MRLAVAGSGFMGAVHLRAIEKIGSIELAGVVSRGESAPRAGNFDDSHRGAHLSQLRRYGQIEEAFEDPQLDAIDLCLPTHLHESAAIAALEHGKHVLVEKPMALDAVGGRRMIDCARRAGRVLMVAHVLRFFPTYRALKCALRSVGTIRSATFSRRCAMPDWNDWQRDPAKSGGAVLDLLIHDIDMALHLFGAPASVEASGRTAGDVDLVSARLHYDGGFTVEIVGGWHAGKFPLSMKYRVIGEHGTIDFDFNRTPPRRHRGGASEDLPLDAIDPFAAEIAYFADCASAGITPAQCPPEGSTQAVGLARTIIEARSRGEKIPWKSE